MSETLAEHLRKFDAACQSSTDAATRQAAEAYLLDFRSKPFAQEVALKILTAHDSSARFSATTKFNAANALRDVLLRNWENMAPAARSDVRLRLFRLAVDETFVRATEHFVVKQLLQLIAVLYKRGWFDKGSDAEGGSASSAVAPSSLHRELLLRLEQLVRHTEMRTRVAGAELMAMLVAEFATSHSVAIGLSVDFHRQCCKSFGDTCLMRIFTLASNAMAGALQSEHAGQADGRAGVLLQQRQRFVDVMLKVLNDALSWDFELKRGRFGVSSAAGGGETGGAASADYHLKVAVVRPPAEWRSVVCSPGLVQLLLRIAKDGHCSERRRHLARQCLVQVASIDGPVFSAGNSAEGQLAAKRRHATLVVTIFQQLLGTCRQARSSQASRFVEESTVDVCTVIQRLSIVFPFVEVLAFLPGIFDTPSGEQSGSACFLFNLVQLLKGIMAEACADAAASKFDSDLTSWHMEATDLLLDAWCKWSVVTSECLRQSAPSAPMLEVKRRLLPFTQEVFKLMCEARVKVAGLQAAANVQELFQGQDSLSAERRDEVGGGTTTIEVVEDEDDDVIVGHPRYSAEDSSYVHAQLQSVAFIGRLNVGANLAALTGAVQARASALLKDHTPRDSEGSGGSIVSLQPPTRSVVQRSEELRWLLLMLGFLVADDFKGELPTVPAVVNDASGSTPPGQKDAVVEIAKTLVALLTSTTAVWQQRLAALAKVGRDGARAPTVVLPHEAVLPWLARRWCATYLGVDPKDYGPRKHNPRRKHLSPSLSAALVPMAARVLEVMVGFCTAAMCVALPVPPMLRNLNTLLFERCLLLLRGVVERRSVRGIVRRNKSPAWAQLVSLHLEGEQGSNPAAALCHLRLRQLPGLPMSFHREWLFTVCVPEAPAQVVRIAASAYGLTVSAVRGVLQYFEGGRAKAGLGQDGGKRAQKALRNMICCLQRLRGMVSAVEDISSRGGAKVLETVLSLLDVLLKDLWAGCGGAQPSTQSPPPESALLFPVLVQVLKLLRDFCTVHLPSMPMAGCNKLFLVVARVFRSLAQRVSGCFIEDECAQLFPIILAILERVASKATLDLSDAGHADSAGAASVPAVPVPVHVAVVGLQTVLPHFGKLAKTQPALVEVYFSLLSWLLADHVDSLARNNLKFFSQLVQSISFGLGHHTASTIRNALTCVRVLTLAKLSSQPAATLLLQSQPKLYARLLQQILHNLLVESFPSGIVADAAAAVLHLLAAERDAYREAVQVVVARANPRVTDKLRSAFRDLTGSNGVTLDYKNRLNRRVFAQNLEKFVQTARPLLKTA